MSLQSQTLHDSALQSYLNKISRLRESVDKSIKAYTNYMKMKMECEAGNRVSCDVSEYQPTLFETVRLIEDLQLHLNTISSYSGLPSDLSKTDNDQNTMDPNSVDEEVKQYLDMTSKMQTILKGFFEGSTASIPSYTPSAVTGLSSTSNLDISDFMSVSKSADSPRTKFNNSTASGVSTEQMVDSIILTPKSEF